VAAPASLSRFYLTTRRGAARIPLFLGDGGGAGRGGPTVPCEPSLRAVLAARSAGSGAGLRRRRRRPSDGRGALPASPCSYPTGLLESARALAAAHAVDSPGLQPPFTIPAERHNDQICAGSGPEVVLGQAVHIGGTARSAPDQDRSHSVRRVPQGGTRRAPILYLVQETGSRGYRRAEQLVRVFVSRLCLSGGRAGLLFFECVYHAAHGALAAGRQDRECDGAGQAAGRSRRIVAAEGEGGRCGPSGDS